MLHVKFSGWRECNKDELKVANNSHGRDSSEHFLNPLMHCHIHCLLIVTYNNPGEKYKGSWHLIFTDEAQQV